MSLALSRPTHSPLAFAAALVVACLVLLASADSALASCANASARPDHASSADVRAATLCLLNDERRDAGLRELEENSRLETAAERHAGDMAERGYFSHQSPDGRSFVDRIKRAGYVTGKEARWTVGENLAWGSGDLGSPARIVSAWMKSPGHRENILSAKYREIGFGMASAGASGGAPARTIYATEFGSRR